jgi:hypothetical protein
MKSTQISVVLFGRDVHLLESRKWVLQSWGYRALSIKRLADLDRVPLTPTVHLLVLCYTLSPEECTDAIARAKLRWPGVKGLALVRHAPPEPAQVFDPVLHIPDAPARLARMVGELVGYAGSSSYSHTY